MGGANGSRECAPDDKLRDTHQLHFMEMMGFAGLNLSTRSTRSPGCCAAPSARSRASSTRYDLRRGALLIQGPSCRSLCCGSRLCGAARRALHRVRDTSGICSRRYQVICPSGSLSTGVSSLISDFPKNISVPTHPKSDLELYASHPTRGAYHDRHGRGEGCVGRGSVRRET